jgi:hypothetical protein
MTVMRPRQTPWLHTHKENDSSRSMPLRDQVARGYPRMPRYFFHIANSKTFKDDLGEQFLGVAEAMAHATDIAKALGEDAGWRDCSVVVEDENGTEIGRVLVNVG